MRAHRVVIQPVKDAKRAVASAQAEDGVDVISREEGVQLVCSGLVVSRQEPMRLEAHRADDLHGEPTLFQCLQPGLGVPRIKRGARRGGNGNAALAGKWTDCGHGAETMETKRYPAVWGCSVYLLWMIRSATLIRVSPAFIVGSVP